MKIESYTLDSILDGSSLHIFLFFYHTTFHDVLFHVSFSVYHRSSEAFSLSGYNFAVEVLMTHPLSRVLKNSKDVVRKPGTFPSFPYQIP
jgi:hypothetical protein